MLAFHMWTKKRQLAAWLQRANGRLVRRTGARPSELLGVTADLSTVRISLDGKNIGTHTRCWSAGQTITDPTHVQGARVLREAFQNPQPPTHEADSGLRDLADYDRAFGVVLDETPVLS